MSLSRRQFLQTTGAIAALSPMLLHGRSIRADRKPNVVWVVNDASRAINYSAYGYNRLTSPGFDSLATDGALFTRAYSTAFWTSPSVSRYMTSRYFPEPCTATTNMGESLLAQVPSDEVLAPSVFSANGYRTYLLTGNTGNVGTKKDYPTRLAVAFDDAIAPDAETVRREPDGRARRKTTMRNLVDAAIPWLHEVKNDPFFLYVHSMETHEPFVVPAEPPYNQWLDESYAGRWIQNGVVGFSPYEPTLVQPEDIRQLMGLYDGGIRYFDTHLMRLVNELNALGLLENTVLVVTSDHGEALLDDSKTHSHVWANAGPDETHHVPLLITGPGVPRGKRFDMPVQSIDILPTLIDLCGIKTEGRMDGNSLTGVWTSAEPHARPPAVTINVPLNVYALDAFYATDNSHKLSKKYDGGENLCWALPDRLGARHTLDSGQLPTGSKLPSRIADISGKLPDSVFAMYGPWVHRVFLTNRFVLNQNPDVVRQNAGDAPSEPGETRWIALLDAKLAIGKHLVHFPGTTPSAPFSIKIDFGVFGGAARLWLEIAADTATPAPLGIQLNGAPPRDATPTFHQFEDAWRWVDAGVFDAPWEKPVDLQIQPSPASTVRLCSIILAPDKPVAEASTLQLMGLDQSIAHEREEALRALGYVR